MPEVHRLFFALLREIETWSCGMGEKLPKCMPVGDYAVIYRLPGDPLPEGTAGAAVRALEKSGKGELREAETWEEVTQDMVQWENQCYDPSLPVYFMEGAGRCMGDFLRRIGEQGSRYALKGGAVRSTHSLKMLPGLLFNEYERVLEDAPWGVQEEPPEERWAEEVELLPLEGAFPEETTPWEQEAGPVEGTPEAAGPEAAGEPEPGDPERREEPEPEEEQDAPPDPAAAPEPRGKRGKKRKRNRKHRKGHPEPSAEAEPPEDGEGEAEKPEPSAAAEPQEDREENSEKRESKKPQLETAGKPAEKPAPPEESSPGENPAPTGNRTREKPPEADLGCNPILEMLSTGTAEKRPEPEEKGPDPVSVQTAGSEQGSGARAGGGTGKGRETRAEDGAGSRQEREEKAEGKGGGRQEKGTEAQAGHRQGKRTEKEKEGDAGAAPDPTMEELLQQIFGREEAGPVREERHYSELENSKAATVALMEDKLVEHIRVLVPGFRDRAGDSMVCREFVSNLVSSRDLEDFIACWEVLRPDCRLEGLDEQAYRALSEEARDYAGVCDLLYRNSLWV